jgi:hypothetical protein
MTLLELLISNEIVELAKLIGIESVELQSSINLHSFNPKCSIFAQKCITFTTHGKRISIRPTAKRDPANAI